MVADRLKKYIKTREISYYAFENSIDASRGSISKAVKDNKSIGSNVLEKIFQVYSDLNPVWLLTGEGNMLIDNNSDALANERIIRTFSLKTDTNIDSQQIPLYDLEAVAGIVPLFNEGKAAVPSDHISIPHLPKCDGAIYVTGDSMYPLLRSGDIVLYKEVKDIVNNIFWGEMYLLSIDNEGEEYITVKFIQRSEEPGMIKLVSENKYHKDKEIELYKVKALALVKATIRNN
ncbi:helix-turn-helix transcriptional regulator [Flavobacterium alkalisoli]|uniref:Helix-turn-helix transcriptional regulator n=1 Tax=Flavobacterium alkalisoli TaxID=2602769 RepID=A0A5B9FRT5_9FLAO|nr:S24 family peptidase [Flavobacterium alkalisoli]QEE48811.1 helix-turn-helix transcriptional regulator [Flavobacterium alkalisoli]